MKTLATVIFLLTCSFDSFAMSDLQIERFAAAQMKMIEQKEIAEFQTKKCLAEKLIDLTNSSVKSVEVYSLRYRTIVENIITNIFVDDVSNYRVNFAFVLDSKKVKVSCGIWSKEGEGRETDLFQNCELENGKKLKISRFHLNIISPNNWFVISKGCLK